MDISNKLSEIEQLVPRCYNKKEIAQEVQELISDPNHEAEWEQVLGLANIIKQGRFSVPQYIKAIRFVSYRMAGRTQKDAYRIVFPDRYNALIAKGYPEKDINSVISSYARSKLVIMIQEQAAIPTWILNQDVYQEAINTQREIMLNPRAGSMARVTAAKCLIENLKQPEKQELQLNIGVTNDTIAELRNTTRQLAELQAKLISSGSKTAQDVLDTDIVEADYEPKEENS